MVGIDSVKFGEIRIDGKDYYSDVTVFWDGKVEYRMKEHVIELGEFIKVARKEPEVLVIGMGQSGSVKIATEVVEFAEGRKIEIFTEVTSKAVEIFNAFAQQGKKVVGIFHVTC